MKEQRIEIVKCEYCNGTGYKGKNICTECNGKKERKLVRYVEVEDFHTHIRINSTSVKNN